MADIPISAAKRIAEAYDYDQVVIVARKVDRNEHVTTYGVDRDNCNVAARIGNFFKHHLMGWPRESEDTATEKLRRIEWGIAHNAGRCSHERKPRWSHVSDTTGLGSASAQELCRRHGVDPDEETGGNDGTD